MKLRNLTPAILLAAAATAADAQTFRAAPLVEDRGVDAVTRSVARDVLDRELFGSPWATAVVGRVDVYDRFPYLESRWFQIVSDPEWNRLLVGEVDGALAAHDGRTDEFGALAEPRGLAVDENGRIYVADSGNHRIVAYDAVSEWDEVRLEPAFVIDGLHRPWDVAWSDAGTPWRADDDRLYVADTGANRVLAYSLDGGTPGLAAQVGQLGSGSGAFAGPTAISVGRADGSNTREVYVADAHGGRLVRLIDRGARLEWAEEGSLGSSLVTSLDVDDWGSIYAASPAGGAVTKLSADLEPIATLDAGVTRPRAFHLAVATRTDHRDGSVSRSGQGAALIVEEWGETSGLRLVRLGVEVRELEVRSESGLEAAFVLTDRASVTGEIVDPASGRVVARAPLGDLDAGRHTVALSADALDAPIPAGDWTLRMVSESPYADAPIARSEAGFGWTGSGAGAIPAFAGLRASSPNPFRGSTTVEFGVPSGIERAWSLTVHDIAGRRVAQLGAGTAAPGIHSVTWDGRDSAGRAVAAGIFFYRLDVGGEVTTMKAVHLR